MDCLPATSAAMIRTSTSQALPPYLAAAERLGIAPEDMVKCVVMEDSSSGLRSGAASGPH